jgi:hypothetical protein
VAVLSEAGASSERELLESCNFDEVVFLCAPFGSMDAMNFGQMFPLPVTPIIYFILPSGKAVVVLKSSFSCSDIHDGISRVLAAMPRSSSSPPPELPVSSGIECRPASVAADAPDRDSMLQRKVRDGRCRLVSGPYT